MAEFLAKDSRLDIERAAHPSNLPRQGGGADPALGTREDTSTGPQLGSAAT